MSNFVIGLDVGIGSVGWAVVNADKLRIEDAGVRLFDSGERQGKETLCQQRRGFRSTRRVIRRRAHRTARLKAHLQVIGLISIKDIDEYYRGKPLHPLNLREKGLSEKLSPEEIASALLHISKHRGYNDFYSIDEESLKLLSKEEQKEFKEEQEQIERYRLLLADMPLESTPAQVFLHHPMFEHSGVVNYRNNKNRKANAPEELILVSREELKKEAHRIWNKQAEFYPCLTEEAWNKASDIMFRQRDFEDGPGDPTDSSRRYGSFLDTVGKCTFYKEEDRGSRFTVIGDLYVLVNRLSQNVFINRSTGEIGLPAKAAEEMINTALTNAAIDIAAIKKILAPYSVEMKNNKEGKSPNACLAFSASIKRILETEGKQWAELVSEDQLDMEHPSFLNRIGEVLSQNRTPNRRINALKALEVSHAAAVKMAGIKPEGTTNVCYRYMRDAIEAFMRGETYGNFQAAKVKELQEGSIGSSVRSVKLPSITDADYVKNPVVFRSINETRKVLNAIIDKHGSPAAINIEVASDLARSFEERRKLNAEKNRRKEENVQTRADIASLLKVDTQLVSGRQCEVYELGKEQDWKCPYCGEPIFMEKAIRPNDRNYEVDHIIPFSLILDNTRNNKVLVHHGCNQAKGQRTPLMWLGQLGENRAKDFAARVNARFGKNRIKLQYLLQPDLNDDRMEEWKSRNINDTRYIAKYLVRYLSENLLFSSNSKQPVHAVKGAITARLRRNWLNEATWGGDKTALREESSLHHAVDAVVIANCTPLTIALAEESMRLYRIYKNEGKRKTEAWQKQFDYAVERICRYNHAPAEYVKQRLANIKIVPALLPELRREVDVRFCDCGPDNEKGYISAVRRFYGDDPEFAKGIRLPIVSIKPERKFRGEITTSNPIGKAEAKDAGLTKHIGENNDSFYNDSKYYCVEIYRDINGNTRMRSIKRSEIKHAGKKLVLNGAAPGDYAEHIMYLMAGDYIVAMPSGKNKATQFFAGYYKSVKNADSRINVVESLGQKPIQCTISKDHTIKKYTVSILGDVYEVKKCGKPLSSIGENN